jgi:hypothetical protein
MHSFDFLGKYLPAASIRFWYRTKDKLWSWPWPRSADWRCIFFCVFLYSFMNDRPFGTREIWSCNRWSWRGGHVTGGCWPGCHCNIKIVQHFNSLTEACTQLLIDFIIFAHFSCSDCTYFACNFEHYFAVLFDWYLAFSTSSRKPWL